MTQLSREAQNLNWLVTNFVRKVPGVAHAVVVSADETALEAGLAKAPAWKRLYFNNDGSIWLRRE